ncbi:MAG: DUF3386 domain-containing protein [Elainellaceae cyanobacterium]
MTASDVTAPNSATSTAARDIFRSAYENRYTWDSSFPGYTADVTYTMGDQTYEGMVRVSSDLKAEVSGIENEQAHKEVSGQLFEIAIHRVRRAFEDTHSKNTFSFVGEPAGEPDDSGTVELVVSGKGEGDRYKVKDSEITMVHRHIHGIVVTIYTFSSHDTGEGYLSHRYDSVYHDPNTGEQKGGKSLITDEYEKVGDYVILNRRYVETVGEANRDLVFSNIQLLSAE